MQWRGRGGLAHTPSRYTAAWQFEAALPMRVLAGVCCMLVAAGAELYFFMKMTILDGQ